MRKELMVGALFVAAVCLTAFGTIAVSGLDLLTPKTVWQVELKDLGGLETGDDVRVLGHLMGVVRQIEFDRSAYTFRLKLKMNENAPIHEGYSISVRDTTALGGKHLYVEPGPPDNPRADRTALVGEPRPSDLMGVVTDVAVEVRKISEKISKGEGSLGKLIAEDDLYRDLADAAKSLKTIAARIEKGQGTVGKLVNEDEIYVQLKELMEKLNNGHSALAKLMNDESGSIIDDLRSASASIKSIAAKADNGSGTLGKLLNDGRLYDNANRTLASASDVMQDVRSGKGIAGMMVTDETARKNASDTLENLRTVSQDLSTGKGTIGKLISDRELYDKMKRLLARAVDSIENARDSAPVSAITSFLMGPFQ